MKSISLEFPSSPDLYYLLLFYFLIYLFSSSLIYLDIWRLLYDILLSYSLCSIFWYYPLAILLLYCILAVNFSVNKKCINVPHVLTIMVIMLKKFTHNTIFFYILFVPQKNVTLVGWHEILGGFVLHIKWREKV